MSRSLIGLDTGEDITLDRLLEILDTGEVNVNAFEDHRGRPGLRGGSLPRSAGTGPTPQQSRAVLKMLRENPYGFSYDPFDDSSPTTGYMSSINDGPIFDPNTPDDQAELIVGDFLKRKEGLIRLPDVYVGGWQNDEDGQFYLDASKNFSDFNEAVTSAVTLRQKSIYHLDKGEVIWMGEWLSKNPDWVAPEGAREWYLENPK